MDKILEKIMNFINENTMLLILICIFLIVILVIYLIDNTIKSKKLEKQELENNNTKEEPTPVVETPVQPVEETPVVPAPVIEPVVEPPKVEEIPVEQVITPVEDTVVETPVEEPKVEEVPVEPVVEAATVATDDIEALLNKDYSINNEMVNSMEIEPIVEPPKVEEVPVEPVKPKYSNDKKLSDIFGKKSEPEVVPTERKIETTQDFSDELDRILQKLNSEESSLENTALEDTTDYSNMF